MFAKIKWYHLIGLLVVFSMVLSACAPAAPEAPAAEEPAAEEPAAEEPAAEEPEATEAPAAEEPMEAEEVTLAIEHFSIIEGTTWSAAQDRAGKLIAEKYPNVNYIFREQVSPDNVNSYAEEMIADESADIVVGNAEFIGLPLKDIADQYPDVYFVAVVGTDVTTKPNFIRYFPRQYQALYLEGLIAGALTETGNIGIVSAFPCAQVTRRQAGFVLGVQDAAELLGKEVNIYVKYAGDWYLPQEEREIGATLVDQYNVDILGQQTDSGSPLDVAIEKGVWFVGKDMDTVDFYGWGDTDTVAVSFDTRWEVLFETMVLDKMAGKTDPETILFYGMDKTMELADGTVVRPIYLANDGKFGVDAISPKALPMLPQEIVDLVKQRNEEMMAGTWDPFTAHELVSNGTGLDLPGLPIPEKGTVVKPAGEVPSDVFLLGEFNFDLLGTTILD